MAHIYHIVKRSDWEVASGAGTYAPKSLEHEGFIHCSRQWQIQRVADDQFRGQTDLVLLCIDVDGVVPQIRNEDLYDVGERFPHIYGPLDVAAVKAVVAFPPAEDGSFPLPTELG